MGEPGNGARLHAHEMGADIAANPHYPALTLAPLLRPIPNN